MSYRQIIGPDDEPLEPNEVINHLELNNAQAEKAWSRIRMLIAVAREEVEGEINRALLTQTWEARLNKLSCPIVLPVQNVQSVASVVYLDADGVEQTLASDQYKLTGWDNRELIPAYNVTWPAVRGDADCVTIRWVAGYGDDGADVPKKIKQWMLNRIGTLFEHREQIIVAASVEKTPFIDNLLDKFRVCEYG